MDPCVHVTGERRAMTTSDSDSDSDAIETLRDVVEDVASYDAREARTREGGDVEDSLVDAD